MFAIYEPSASVTSYCCPHRWLVCRALNCITLRMSPSRVYDYAVVAADSWWRSMGKRRIAYPLNSETSPPQPPMIQAFIASTACWISRAPGERRSNTPVLAVLVGGGAMKNVAPSLWRRNWKRWDATNW